MKKIIFLLIALMSLSCCAGSQQPSTPVSSNPTDAPKQNQQEVTNEPVSANNDGYIFVYKDKNIYMDEEMTAVLDKLGEPASTFEAPSCAFPGEIDKVFSYAGVDIHTYPEDGADYVHTVNYMDDSVKTPEGIRLGDSFDDVAAAYGSGYAEEMGMYTYTKGETYLRFLINDADEVITITYGLTEHMEVL